MRNLITNPNMFGITGQTFSWQKTAVLFGFVHRVTSPLILSHSIGHASGDLGLNACISQSGGEHRDDGCRSGVKLPLTGDVPENCSELILI